MTGDELIKKSTARLYNSKRVKQYKYIKFDGVDTFTFAVASVTTVNKKYRILIKLTDLLNVLIERISDIHDLKEVSDVLEEAFSGDVRVACSCEDFLYSGGKYWTYIGQAGIEKETRRPQSWKPKLYLCKHLIAVLPRVDQFLQYMCRDVSKAFEPFFKKQAQNKERGKRKYNNGINKYSDETTDVEDETADEKKSMSGFRTRFGHY